MSRPPTRALIGWRLLALLYDALPVLALWLAVAALATVGFHLAGHATRESIAPFSGWQWAIWAACWAVTGLYATLSWRRGGQTLGMRPWRLRVVDATGGPPSARALWLRYAVGSVSLLAAGLGFWWAWLDRDRLTWHDRISRTRLLRDAPLSRNGAGTARTTPPA